jgi:hypothetical protein
VLGIDGFLPRPNRTQMFVRKYVDLHRH